MDESGLSLLRALRPRDRVTLHVLRATPGSSLDASLREGGFVGLDLRALLVHISLEGRGGGMSFPFDDVLLVERRHDGIHMTVRMR